MHGRYDHKFLLSDDDRVTIIHGPNGVGKTVLLRMLFHLFNGRFFELLRIKFSRFQVELSSGVNLVIDRNPAGDERPGFEPLRIKYITPLGLEHEVNLRLEQRVLSRFATTVSRRTPWVERLDDDVWVDRRTGERLSSLDLLGTFDFGDSERVAGLSLGDALRPLAEAQKIMSELAEMVNVHIIETQRLLRTGKKFNRRLHSEVESGDLDVRTTVSECAEDIQRRITKSLSVYATESQKLDRTFPHRLLAFGPQPKVEVNELRQMLLAIDARRKSIAATGLLIEGGDDAEDGQQFSTLDLNSASDVQRSVISLYADDTNKKLDVLDTLASSMRLLLDVLNDRFRHKRLMLSREKGLVAITDEGSTISLESLSSGEQHHLVMFFDLLFKVPKDALVLIDEPELSLHITWQKNLLRDLLSITEKNHFDIVLATHSPYVISHRIDLMRELSTGDYTDEDFALERSHNGNSRDDVDSSNAEKRSIPPS